MEITIARAKARLEGKSEKELPAFPSADRVDEEGREKIKDLFKSASGDELASAMESLSPDERLAFYEIAGEDADLCKKLIPLANLVTKVAMQDVSAEIAEEYRAFEGKMLFIALPCFLKALHLAMKVGEELRSRIGHTIGLVCGHLKTKKYAAYLARHCGVDESQIRFRGHYFPFTEPSIETDLQCTVCGGAGCRLCKHSGWVEVIPGGMIHPNVLKNVGIDPTRYSGFAFGAGVDRIAALWYRIPDIRLLYENDLRFLEQF